jgi:hypothetical protein
MKTTGLQSTHYKHLIISAIQERILHTIWQYRFMTALDVCHLHYSPSSLTYVRDLLSSLAGGEDGKTAQYLYRFQLPNTSPGNTEKIYTLGSKGRTFLEKQSGLLVDWLFRPNKVKHLSYSQVVHNLVLTRFLVAAHSWCTKQTNIKIVKTRICYELYKTPSKINVARKSNIVSLETVPLGVVPDAWLLFVKLDNGSHKHYPVLLEIDRGMEYRDKFKKHVRSRVDFIRSGVYRKVFLTEAVIITYVTTGERPEYRETRLRAMCAWTQDVLADLHLESWAAIFRFTSLQFDELYSTPIFSAPLWYRPDSPTPVPLFDA